MQQYGRRMLIKLKYVIAFLSLDSIRMVADRIPPSYTHGANNEQLWIIARTIKLSSKPTARSFAI